MADKNLSKEVSSKKGTEVTLDQFQNWTQNGTGQQSGSRAPIAIVSVPRKNPDAVESLIYQAIKRNWSDADRTKAYAIVDSDLSELFDQVFGDKLAQVGLANNVKFVLDIYNRFHDQK